MPVEIRMFRCLSDNVGVLLHDTETGATATIDAPEADAVSNMLSQTGWTLSDILVTHEHADHIQGIPTLVERTGARVTGSEIVARAVKVDREVGEGSSIDVGSLSAAVRATPGHAAGHVIYHFPEHHIAFVGDVLFVMGCGRILPGGTPEQLWGSLEKVAALPDQTRIWGGHDYTLSNARFAMHVDPDNAALRARLAEAEAAKASGRFWGETDLASEKATNPFLRAGEPALAKSAGLPGASPLQVFARLREMKNSF